MNFLGIDPGKSGALAVVDGLNYAAAYKMPETRRDLWDLLKQINSQSPIIYALVEELHAMPAAVEEKLGIKRGSISTWKLGQHYGEICMGLIAADIRFEERVPSVWQKIMSCRTGGDKNVSKARAQQLFPQIKCTHHISDALLIASTARILWLNSHPAERAQVPEPVIYPVAEERMLFT